NPQRLGRHRRLRLRSKAAADQQRRRARVAPRRNRPAHQLRNPHRRRQPVLRRRAQRHRHLPQARRRDMGLRMPPHRRRSRGPADGNHPQESRRLSGGSSRRFRRALPKCLTNDCSRQKRTKALAAHERRPHPLLKKGLVKPPSHPSRCAQANENSPRNGKRKRARKLKAMRGDVNGSDEAIRATASKDSPWFVVPADNKWFTRLVVAAAIVEAVEKLDLQYPKVTPDQKKDLAGARAELMAEK